MRSANILAALCGGLAMMVADAAAVPPATIEIAAPGDGAAVTLGGDAQRSVELEVRVGNFTLKPQGQCAGAADCGHVRLKIDPAGDSCNAPAARATAPMRRPGRTASELISASAQRPKAATSSASGSRMTIIRRCSSRASQ